MRLNFIFMMFLMSFNAMAFNGGSFFGEKERLLSSEEAFNADFLVSNNDFLIMFDISDGYHVYADKVLVSINDVESKTIGGETVRVDDEFFGNVDVLKGYQKLKIESDDKSEKINIKIEYQGCASKLNVCYPVEKIESVFLNPNYDSSIDLKVLDAEVDSGAVFGKPIVELDSSASISNMFISVAGDNLIYAYILSFIAGCIVAFTPCIYPMIPIITGVVVSNKKESPVKLTSYYVLGIAICYTSIFIALELMNINIQTIMMNNITAFITGSILVLLSFVVIGFLNFNIPSGFQNKINNINDKLSGKNSIALIPSGFLSALILSPCATAPLAGVMMFSSILAESHNLYVGSLFMFVFGLGIGFPIIIFTTYMKKYMPKNGNWMNIIKYILGALILLIGFSMMAKSMSNYLSGDTIDVLVFLFNSLVLIGFVELIIKGRFNSISYIRRLIRYTIIAFITVYLSFFLESKFEGKITNNGFDFSEWNVVDSLEGMNKIISNGKDSVVFVSADWCVVCDKLKEEVLSNDDVKHRLKDYNKIYVDITNSDDNVDIANFYGMKIAPYFVFYNSYGDAFNEDKFVGYIKKDRFVEILDLNSKSN